MAEALLCPELSQLWWTNGARATIESIDRYFWEEIIQDKRTRGRGTWYQNIYLNKWSDEYGFAEAQENALLTGNAESTATMLAVAEPPPGWFNAQVDGADDAPLAEGGGGVRAALDAL